MLRRILLGAIMLVSIVIIVYSLQQMRAKQEARNKARTTKAALSAPTETSVEIFKYDKQTNDLVAIIRGKQARQALEKGPVDILKPVVTLFRDKNTFTVITADTGRVEGSAEDRMQQGWLRQNVVITILDRANEDNTIITCDELKFFGDKQQVAIPGELKAHNSQMDLTGVSLTADQNFGHVQIDRNVQLVLRRVKGGLGALGGAAAEKPEAEAPAAPPEPIIITCDGALVFKSDVRQATFQQEVKARQGQNAARADLMLVEFERGGSLIAPPTDAPADKAGGLEVRRVVMTADSKEGVVVEGPDRKGFGDKLTYDARDGSLVYSGAPCRAWQKSQNQAFEITGAEIQFGRKRLLSQAEALPAGMTETSQKVLVTGKPARVVSVPEAAGQEPMALLGDRILFDQDARIAWLEGVPDRRAVASQGKSRIEGVEVLLIEKTATRGERAAAKGPGRLETAASGSSGREGPPAFVEFGGDMNYKPAEDTAQFTGGIRFSDGSTICTSRALDVDFAEGPKSGSREVRRMIATGDVVVTGEKMDAKSDVLVYGYPTKGSRLTTATLTAKPGNTCEARQGDIFCRAERIDMAERPAADGKTAMHATASGKGFIQYGSKPAADGSKPGQTFEVRFTQSGTYDDADLKAVFDGDARLTRTDMDLRGWRIVMNFARKPATDLDKAAGKTGALDVAGITATDNVTLVQGKPTSPMTITGDMLVWDRLKNVAQLVGSPAHVENDRNDLTAPRMDAVLDNDSISKITTTGGGRMIGYTQSSISGGTKQPAPANADNAPSEPKLSRMDVTWSGEGYYEKLDAKDPATEPTAFVRVKENARAVSEDSDCTADILKIFLGPPKGEEGKTSGLKLQVREAIAEGNAHAKAFNPDGNYYRYARGDKLTWDRLTGRMVVASESGDAVVWDNSNEWTGRELVVNRTETGKFEATSTSGRRITFYEEGTPKIPTDADEAKKWKPIY